jgi:hypothetical protein
MAGASSRWPSAAAISISLHALVVLATWHSSSRWGSGRFLEFDELVQQDSRAGPRFEPGALIPIELAKVEPHGRAIATEDSSKVDTPVPGGSRGDSETEQAEPRRSSNALAYADTPEPMPTTAPDSSLVRGRGEATGLLGSGRMGKPAQTQAIEGPTRPAEQLGAPPNKDIAFEREGDEWVYHAPGDGFTATVRPDGGVDFRNRVVAFKVGSMPAVATDGEEFVTLDIEHDAMAIIQIARGRDPSPRAKAILLAATADTRLEIAEDYQHQRMIEELGRLTEQLDAIWTGRRSLAERKRLLFALWDECEELDPRDSDIDETRRELGHAARQKILRYIAQVAPAGSPEAFTETELAQVNARRVSRRKFAPY